MKNLKVTGKILIIVGLFVVVFLILGIYSVLEFRNELKQNTQGALISQASANAEALNTFLSGYIQLVDFLSEEANVKGVYKNEHEEEVWMIKLFKTIAGKYKDILFVYIGLEDKRMYLIPETELPEGYDPTSRPWYKDAMAKKGEVIITDPYADASTGKLVITVARAVRDNDGNYVGVVAIDFDASTLSKSLMSKGKEFGYMNAVVSQSGNILLHTDESLIGKNVADQEFFKQWISSGQNGLSEYVYNKEKRWTAYYKMSNGWIVASLILEKTALAEANKKSFVLFIIIIVGVVLATIISIFIAGRYIVKPLQGVAKSAEQLGHGDLTVRFEYDSKDEIGLVAKAMNNTVSTLREIAGNIQNGAAKIERESANVAAVTEETSASIEDLSHKFDAISTNVNNASAAIEEVTSGVEEVAASAQNVANASQRLSEEAQAVNKLANDGRKAIENISKVIEITREKATNTYGIVSKLSESAKNIGEIVDTINSIAEQTNLLALNAAIEAARAGEAGRGFAVVADEIRKLAEESKQATQNIANILRGIVESSMKAGEATQETVEVVEQAAEGSKEVNERFESILKSVNTIGNMIESLAASAQEQSASAEEMSSAMDNASRSMVIIVEQINEATYALKQQSSALESAAKTADQLDELAKQLVEAVRRFKL